ncbi:MAG TPA: isoprenylcysteine carboxylmethyltransferase family protein [Paracoccaceae bacterium]|nr:isoprenylcysteine carboxylmethyltransferase family protein [Paracoccaceae bacterium]
MHRFADIPPVWTLGLGFAAWGLARVLPFWRFGWGWLPGIVLILAGFGLAIWAIIWFARKDTSIRVEDKPSALVIEGPYRLNRNPMYTGLTLILAGWALWLGALSALIPAIALPILLTKRFIEGEEAGLRAKFGADAERFFARTRRW